LPPGIHWATWAEVTERFGTNDHRKQLLNGLEKAMKLLRMAGCKAVFLDGSFVTTKEWPNDYDCCWDSSGVNTKVIDRSFFDFEAGRLRQRMKFGGDFFPSGFKDENGRTFVELFQVDKETGGAKGIVGIRLEESA